MRGPRDNRVKSLPQPRQPASDSIYISRNPMSQPSTDATMAASKPTRDLPALNIDSVVQADQSFATDEETQTEIEGKNEQKNDRDGAKEVLEDKQAPIQKLSNELLTKVIHGIDAPSAFRFGPTCKQFYNLVPFVCFVEFKAICPKHDNDVEHEPTMLQQYHMKEAKCQVHQLAEDALDVLYCIFEGTMAIPVTLAFHPAYIGLMRQLYMGELIQNYEDEECSMNGHLKCVVVCGGSCALCPIISTLKAYLPCNARKSIEWCGISCKHPERIM